MPTEHEIIVFYPTRNETICMDEPNQALFDPTEYRMIDIGYTVTPGENPDRPFAIQKGILADGSYKYDILDTHSHVGSHVEASGHYFGHDDGTPIVDFPLSRFYGPGVLFAATETEITAETLSNAISDTIEPGDYVVARNDTPANLDKEDAYSADADAPAFTPEAAEWLRDQEITGVILGDVGLGRTVEDSNEFHEILMQDEVVFVEIVDNLHAITKDRFTIMALPYKVERLGSSFCRPVVIEKQ